MPELERVVAALELGEVPLEEFLSPSIRRGAALRAHCEEKLKAAEEQVSQIAQAPDGTIGMAKRSRSPDGHGARTVLTFTRR